MITTLRELLEAGAHFGHQTNRWNPKMKPFIFESRKGIYIIDLQKTVKQLISAYKAIEKLTSEGHYILFVGTKKQAVEVIRNEANRCDMPFVCERWLGGTLTNMLTVRKSIGRLEAIEQMEEDGTIEKFTKKEAVHLRRDKMKLERNLGGIRYMESLPGLVFVIDPEREKIAIKEARKLSIPIVAIIDTNCDPTLIDYPIPANDDAIKTISLIASKIADAVMSGSAKISDDVRKKKEKRKVVKKEEKKEEKIEPKKAKAPKAEKLRVKEAPAINKIQIDTEVFSEDLEEKLEKTTKQQPKKKVEKKEVVVLGEIEKEVAKKKTKKKDKEEKTEEKKKPEKEETEAKKPAGEKERVTKEKKKATKVEKEETKESEKKKVAKKTTKKAPDKKTKKAASDKKIGKEKKETKKATKKTKTGKEE